MVKSYDWRGLLSYAAYKLGDIELCDVFRNTARFEKYEHEHFVNMVVNYGLTVATIDGSETLQDPRRNTP